MDLLFLEAVAMSVETNPGPGTLRSVSFFAFLENAKELRIHNCETRLGSGADCCQVVGEAPRVVDYYENDTCLFSFPCRSATLQCQFERR